MHKGIKCGQTLFIHFTKLVKKSVDIAIKNDIIKKKTKKSQIFRLTDNKSCRLLGYSEVFY